MCGSASRRRKALIFKNLNQFAVDTADAQEAGFDLRKWLHTMVEQSGLDLTVRKVLTISVVVGLILGLVGGLLRQSVLVAAVTALVGAAMPLAYVELKRRSRLEKLLSQLPDAFDLMSRVVRAGQTMSQALQAVADEFASPSPVSYPSATSNKTSASPPTSPCATWPAAPACSRSNFSSRP